MGDDTRYKIEHIGDSFANMLENMCSSIGECNILKKVPDAAKASADAIKKYVPEAAKAAFDFVKKAPEALKSPMDLLKKIPTCNPLDLMKKVPDTAKSSARGVILTYDIHELSKKKEKIVREVGERIVALRRETPEISANDDETMRALLLEIDAIDSKLEDYTNEREMRLYPVKGTEEAEETPATEVHAEAVAIETETKAQEEVIEEASAPKEQDEAVTIETETEAQEEVEEASADEEQAEAVATETEPEVQEEVVEEAPAPKSKKRRKKAKARAEAAVEEASASDEVTKIDAEEPSDEDTEGSGIEVLSPELADADEDEDDK